LAGFLVETQALSASAAERSLSSERSSHTGKTLPAAWRSLLPRSRRRAMAYGRCQRLARLCWPLGWAGSGSRGGGRLQEPQLQGPPKRSSPMRRMGSWLQEEPGKRSFHLRSSHFILRVSGFDDDVEAVFSQRLGRTCNLNPW